MTNITDENTHLTCQNTNFENKVLENIINETSLNTKKNILDCINKVKILDKEGIKDSDMQLAYNEIYNSIEKMKSTVKTNTIMYLNNDLKSNLSKFVKEKDPKKEDAFLKFFKEAYPKNKRKKDFTMVLTDIDRITLDQIWTTLAYINSICLKNENSLTLEDKESIKRMILKIKDSKNLKYINNVKSLQKLNKVL